MKSFTSQFFKLEALGLGMAGLAAGVERMVREVCERFKYVTYLEIGIASGGTLAPIADMLRALTTEWRAVGVDLPNGYSLDLDAVNDAMRERLLPFVYAEADMAPGWNGVTIYQADSQSFLRSWEHTIHLALIDGCHCKDCVMHDFLHIEPFVVHGGIVMMHDISADQIGHDQPHRAHGLNVRGACLELGLLHNTRKGWQFVEELVGDRKGGGWNMGIFKKE